MSNTVNGLDYFGITSGTTSTNLIHNVIHKVINRTYEVGAWNMDTTTSVSIAHTLSATEWLQIHTVSAMITNDNNSNLSVIGGSVGTGSILVEPDCYISKIDSTNITLTRSNGGSFDSSSYDDADINRGNIYLTYTVD